MIKDEPAAKIWFRDGICILPGIFWMYQDEVLDMGLMSCVGVEIEQHGIIDLLIPVGCIAVQSWQKPCSLC